MLRIDLEAYSCRSSCSKSKRIAHIGLNRPLVVNEDHGNSRAAQDTLYCAALGPRRVSDVGTL